MKKALLSVAIIVAIGFTSCTSEKKADKEKVKTEEVQKEEMSHDKMDHDKMAVAEYQCPMKCEGDKTYADKDHKCPVCKMDLKEVKHEDNHDEKESHDNDEH